MSVLPDITGVDRLFDYEVPTELADRIQTGSVVRIPLQGRRVRGWVVATGVTPTADVTLRRVAAIVSRGPSPEIVELARFGAWRYAGRLRPFLVAGSPPTVVSAPGPPANGAAPAGQLTGAATTGAAPTGAVPPGVVNGSGVVAQAVARALVPGLSAIRLPPSAPRLDLVEELLAQMAGQHGRAQLDEGSRSPRTDILVLVPERREAETLVRRLELLGHPVALYPERWAAAAGGGRIVVGNRTAALATMRRLAAVLVLDAHAEAYVEQRSPTWAADVLVAERAARAGVPCILVSPCPTLEQLSRAQLIELPRSAERAGWPALEVVDRRSEDPRSGLYSPRLAQLISAAIEERPDLPAVCVLNRTGRARLFACGSCGELVRCEHCGAALGERQGPAAGEARRLDCPRCGLSQPALCTRCGSTRLKLLRVGVGRAAEELAALTGRTVAEMSGPRRMEVAPDHDAQVVVGTQAALHRLRAASIVVFLDFDQELLAPRYRAGEEALALLARAARLVGAVRSPATPGSARWPSNAPPRSPGRIAVQTRQPGHEVVQAALHGDPAILAAAESPRRAAFGLPPTRALAVVTGEGAAELVRSLPGELEVASTGEGRYIVRARDASMLADALQGTGLIGSGPRVDVDPLDV